MAYSKLELKVRRLEREFITARGEQISLYNKWVCSQARERALYDKLTVTKNRLEQERKVNADG